MNQQERDELRAKHRMHTHSAERGLFCRFCDSRNEWDWCKSCRLEWPCDTIKVLDALDEVLVQVNAPIEVDQHECDHTDDTGLCWCESGFKRCPECHEWFGIDHARKDMTATNVVTESASVSATWLGSCPHQADSRLLPGLDLTTEIATSVMEECECGEKL